MHDPDHAWVDDFLDRLLALWRQHADTPTGLFNPYLDRQWRHHVDGPRTLVTQCRLIYNFARAFERSGDQGMASWRAAVSTPCAVFPRCGRRRLGLGLPGRWERRG